MRENPYQPFRRVRGAVDSAKRVTDERFGAWELGYNARCPEGWIVVRLDEHEARMRECEALRLEREDARSERDAALDAGQKLADLVTLLGGYDGPGYLAAPNQGERPDYVAAARLFSKIMRDETNGAAAALAAWRSVSGSSEPR